MPGDLPSLPRGVTRAARLPLLLRDLRQGTDVALPTAHCLRASEIALRAQQLATRLHVDEGAAAPRRHSE